MFAFRALATSFAIAAVTFSGTFAGTAAFAQQSVPALYDGSSTTFTLTPGSNLRLGDSLTSRIAVTLWQGAQLKGVGTCSQTSCPVAYDGQNLFARRTRLKLPGVPGSFIGSGSGTSTSTGAITRTLRRGDDGSDVMRLQEALNRAGASLTIDRTYGRGTRAAVEAYQRARGLKVDGVAGPATLQALGV
jgi:Putative peptidoglycan binding domain